MLQDDYKWGENLENLAGLEATKSWNWEEMLLLLSGHDCLAACLHAISILSFLEYVLCCEKDSLVDQEHLSECMKLNDWTKDLTTLYWDARWITISQMSEYKINDIIVYSKIWYMRIWKHNKFMSNSL